ncbi:hypothetical protein HOV43_gp206 [Escherichia phage vB_EcoM_KWBSE43-6]|uniref:Uncharacterized protein n=1 Tax=Escherichia phage vB_EcoM_KWBSE43-6 TaxID=2508194 RepID=A0A482MXV6_9CAUD|nr:hypothetical protein HOV43_gp206 [Escherichia phage vB_EcoM_KWBSE43-6]QBQ78977.1 hypothetical protein KWBSE43_00157 [Escherichia phage vB_EcoM_KWBSE43-6]
MKFSIIETEVNPGSELRNFLVVPAGSEKETEDNWILSFKHDSVDTLQETASRYLIAFGVLSSLSLSLDNTAIVELVKTLDNTSVSS